MYANLLVIQDDALANFLGSWGDGYLAGDTGSSFSCTEIDVLADLFRAFGMDDAADSWISGHADGDDEGDRHFRCEDCGLIQDVSDDTNDSANCEHWKLGVR